MADESKTGDRVRLDAWLWRARFFRNRAAATAFVAKGAVRVTRAGATAKVNKPGLSIRAGDVLTFSLGGRLVSVCVRDPGRRRGSADEARGLYDRLEEPGGADG